MKSFVISITAAILATQVSAIPRHEISSNKPKKTSISTTVPLRSVLSHSKEHYDPLHHESYADQQEVTQDQCYQVPEDIYNVTSESLSGLERTLSILENISRSDRELWEALDIPPHLIEVLENRQSYTYQNPKDDINQTIICPNDEELSPCTCYNRLINCSATGNFTKIKEIFNTAIFMETSFEFFIMHGMGVVLEDEVTLLANTFGPASFQTIIIENTNLQEVNPDAFKGSENSLKEISLNRNSDLYAFPFDSMHLYSNLEIISLQYNKLQSICCLLEVPLLKSFLLDHNEITNIDPYAFTGLKNLQVLDLSNNQLEVIKSHDFAFTSPDVLLYLDYNFISNIEDDAISKEQPSLLDIYHNELTTLNITVFKPILEKIISQEEDSYIEADSNPLCCMGIEWILNNPVYLTFIILPNIDCYTEAIASSHHHHLP